MRGYLKERYSPQFYEKVKKMPDDQVIAIYNNSIQPRKATK